MVTVSAECVTTALGKSMVMVLHRLALPAVRDELRERGAEDVAGVEREAGEWGLAEREEGCAGVD
jgi:hypothetical protein